VCVDGACDCFFDRDANHTVLVLAVLEQNQRRYDLNAITLRDGTIIIDVHSHDLAARILLGHRLTVAASVRHGPHR
jgi:hypothetical protein